ncbi:MAG: hypothetical protein JJU36_13930 [Phycisphaeraceae bacterium]|nr:hypothetical protein [Phycisphaeraceae bacterium]
MNRNHPSNTNGHQPAPDGRPKSTVRPDAQWLDDPAALMDLAARLDSDSSEGRTAQTDAETRDLVAQLLNAPRAELERDIPAGARERAMALVGEQATVRIGGRSTGTRPVLARIGGTLAAAAAVALAAWIGFEAGTVRIAPDMAVGDPTSTVLSDGFFNHGGSSDHDPFLLISLNPSINGGER